jgi:pimeloyl-ACP methyl ester carboxylesterase
VIGSGRTIDLDIAVLPATGSSSERQSDPLFLLAGGPGQAATEAYGGALYLFQDANRLRDIVLIDQRGTGDSNGLACANLEDEELPDDLPDEAVVDLLDDCREALADKADLSQYTTALFIQDLDAVREALGYDRINLYGASYGTRAAQAYMRRYPERVRSAVLDAVVGPEQVLYLQMPRDAQRSLDSVFDRCEADPACHQQFPAVRREYSELLDRLEQPVAISVAHPLSNEPIDLTMDRERLGQFVFNILYSPDFQSLLPLLIHHAHETGDYTPLVIQGLAVAQSTGLYPGLLYAVICSEDAPLIDADTAAGYQAGTTFPLFAERFTAICETWPRAAIDPGFRDPLQSDIPALLLSGSADPITPPIYAGSVAEGLSNSRQLILPGYGHGVIGAGCMPKIVAEFFRTGDPAAPDTSCLEELQPPPFFTSFAGPEP